MFSLNTECLKKVKLSLLKNILSIYCSQISVSIGRTLTEDRDHVGKQSYVQTAPVSDLAQVL